MTVVQPTTRLSVASVGLPAGAQIKVVIWNNQPPFNRDSVILTSGVPGHLFDAIPPGTYAIQGDSLNFAAARYRPASSFSVSIASLQTASVILTYREVGEVRLAIVGASQSLMTWGFVQDGKVVSAQPDNAFDHSGTLRYSLPLGAYELYANSFTSFEPDGSRIDYTPKPSQQTVIVVRGGTAAQPIVYQKVP